MELVHWELKLSFDLLCFLLTTQVTQNVFRFRHTYTTPFVFFVFFVVCFVCCLLAHKQKDKTLSNRMLARWLENNGKNVIRVIVNGKYDIFFNKGEIGMNDLSKIIFDVLNYHIHGRYANRYQLKEWNLNANCSLGRYDAGCLDYDIAFRINIGEDFTVQVGFKDEYKLNYNRRSDLCAPLTPVTVSSINDNYNSRETSESANVQVQESHCEFLEEQKLQFELPIQPMHHLSGLVHDDVKEQSVEIFKYNYHYNGGGGSGSDEYKQNQQKCKYGKGCPCLVRLKNNDYSNLNSDRIHLLVFWHPLIRNIHCSKKYIIYFKSGKDAIENNIKSGTEKEKKTRKDSKVSGRKQKGNFACFHGKLTPSRLTTYNENELIVLEIKEIILNGFEQDLAPKNKQNKSREKNSKFKVDTLTYDKARKRYSGIFDILIENMIHPFHKKMGEPLNKAMMLSLILFTHCSKLKKDFNQSFVGLGSNEINEKWIVFDFCLHHAIWRLSERENQLNNLVYTCICDINFDRNKLKCCKKSNNATSKPCVTRRNISRKPGWIKMKGYQSFTKSLTNATTIIDNKGTIFGGKQSTITQMNNNINVNKCSNDDNKTNYSWSCYSCSLDWISPFPNEKEVVFTRGILFPICQEFVQQDLDSKRKRQFVCIDGQTSLKTIFGEFLN